jgi:hypothetical protein
MDFDLRRGLRVIAAAAAVAGGAPRLAGAPAPTPPVRLPAPVPAGPLVIHTAPLVATGLGSVEAPFSLKLTTQPLAAEGLGTREPPFRPLVVKTDALTARGRGAAPGGPK